jgi:HEAT repeat protein
VGDPFWRETIRLYASQGDTAPLIERLLSEPDTFLRQRLLMAASCMSRGTKVSRPETRSRVIAALDELAKGPVLYLKKKAIDALAALETPEAYGVLRSHYRKEDGKLDFESYASKYAVQIDGSSAADEMVEAFVRLEDTPREALEALRCLPRDQLIPILLDFINNDNYPQERQPEQNFCVRHRRRDSARLLAEIGEWEALPHLQAALRSTRLTDYVREGMVRAIATLPGEGTTRLLQEILADGTLPTDCRVSAAGFLGAIDPEAGAYLRHLVADRTANHYDRKDAASALQKFTLSPADVPIFSALLFDDRPEVFWGGPAYAAEALHKIDDPSARAALNKAEQQWRQSANPDRGLVLQRLVVRSKPAGDVRNRAELTRHLAQIRKDNWDDRKQVVLDYYSQHQSDAHQLFEQWLALAPDECGFVPGDASLVIGILDGISITPAIARSLKTLALRHPWDERLWQALAPYDSLLEPGAS